MSTAKPRRYRFGPFEANLENSTLYENGNPVLLQGKPFQFLAALLESEGGLVTREELSRRLWPDTHVEVDQGLNAAVRKVRIALRDNAFHPRFIETLGSRGYRFIHALQPLASEGSAEEVDASRASGKAISVDEMYLRARHFLSQRTPATLRKALFNFEQVAKADPQHAGAHVGVADAYFLLATHGVVIPKQAFQQARAAATRALRLNPGLAQAHVALAWSELALELSWKDAHERLERAMALDADYPFTHAAMAYYLLARGNMETGLAAMVRARELDPLSLPVNSLLSFAHYYARDFATAVDAGESALELDSHFPVAHASVGLAYLGLRRDAEALKHFEDAVRFSGQAPMMVAHLAYALAVCGHTERALETLEELSHPCDGRIIPAYHIALALLALGQYETGFAWLRRAQEMRFPWTLFLRIDPRLDAVRYEPEFEELVSTLRLEDAE